MRDNKQSSWSPTENTLIFLVKQYPVIYYPCPTKRPSKEVKYKLNNAWDEIAPKVHLPAKTCKQQWADIKYKYAKLMILINTGKIAKEFAMSKPETARFLDGLLSFLDPVITKITDEDIPYRIHKAINSVLKLTTRRRVQVIKNEKNTQFVTHSQVKALILKKGVAEGFASGSIDTLYVQKVVDAAIKRKLEELHLIDSMSSIPNNDENVVNVTMDPRNSIPNVYKRKPSMGLGLGLESELIIEDDIKMENEVDGIEEKITPDKNMTTNILSNSEIVLPMNTFIKMENEVDDIEESITPHILTKSGIIVPMNTLNNDAVIEHNTQDIAMTDIDESTPSDDYVKNFFKELGEVMSLELSFSKQKILKSRINDLLKTLLFDKH